MKSVSYESDQYYTKRFYKYLIYLPNVWGKVLEDYLNMNFEAAYYHMQQGMFKYYFNAFW